MKDAGISRAGSAGDDSSTQFLTELIRGWVNSFFIDKQFCFDWMNVVRDARCICRNRSTKTNYQDQKLIGLSQLHNFNLQHLTKEFAPCRSLICKSFYRVSRFLQIRLFTGHRTATQSNSLFEVKVKFLPCSLVCC